MRSCTLSKTRILDRDHRLVGEGLDDFDFPLGEGDRLVARYAEDPMVPLSPIKGTHILAPYAARF